MHEPAKLDLVDRYPRKGGQGQRKFNVWHVVLVCQICGRRFVRLANPIRRRTVRCVGTDQLQVTSKERTP